MLDFAIKYKDTLQSMFIDTWYTEKYKYFHYTVSCNIPEFRDNTWDYHDFVSIDHAGHIIGNIYYHIDSY